MTLRWFRAALLAALCVPLFGCGQDAPPAPKSREVRAESSVVRVEEAIECRSFPAQVEARNSVTLASKLSGSVMEVLAQEGALLKAGDPILRIDDKDLQSREQGLKASMAQAASERQALAARVSHAKANLDRLSRLLAQKVISQDDHDKARMEFLALSGEEEAVSARERAVAAQLEELRALGGYTRINAPFAGRLTRRFVDQGAFVSAGQVLAQMDDLSGGYDLTAQVDESLLPQVAAGQRVMAVIPAASPEPFAVTVSAVIGRVDPATRTFRLKAALQPAQAGAQAGMYGRLFLPARAARKVLLPAACLVRRGDLPAVFTADGEGVLSFRVVKPGGRFIPVTVEGKSYLTDSEAFDDPSRPAFVEILSGLTGGERVACSNTETLREGDRLAKDAQ